MCNQIFKNVKKACFIGMLSVLTIAPWQNATAEICFVLDQDCIDGISGASSSTRGCEGYNADKNYGLTNDTVTCESCTDSNGATIKHQFKCKCKKNGTKCVDSKCSECKYTTNDTCPTSEYKYSSDKGLGWDCDPCIDKFSKQWGKYKCKCDDTIGYWMVNNNCSKDPCYSIFKAPASSRVTLSEAARLENLEYTCDKCAASEQSQFAGKASCVCDGIIDSQRNNRCIPKGRCDTAGYYYTKASCQAVWGLSGICREITSGQYKYCIQGEDDKDDVCPSPWKTKKSDCTTPFIAEHPSVTTPKSHQPCFDCREKECKPYDGFNYFKEECLGEQEKVNVPLSASNVTSVSGGKKLSTIDLECTCPQEGPGSGTEKSLNGQMYTYYDMSPCCKWLAKVDADTKQILDDIESLKDKSSDCAVNGDKCWYNTFTSRGCTKRYEDEMKSKEYKWTDADKKSKEDARTHFCYYPDKDKCDIMNKCDLYKCDTAYFDVQVADFDCVTNTNFTSGKTSRVVVNQPTQISFSNGCSGNKALAGWVLGETPPDISTGAKLAAYMRSYTPKLLATNNSGVADTSGNIKPTAEILRKFNVQTTGECNGSMQVGVLNVFPFVKTECPTGSKFNKTSTSLTPDNYKCGVSGSKGYNLINYNFSVYSDACKSCNAVYKCTKGYATEARGGRKELKLTDGYYYGDYPCYAICPTSWSSTITINDCGWTAANGWELITHTSYSNCQQCKAKTCPAGYSTAATNFGTSSTYAGNKTCYQICPTGYSNTITLSDCSSDTSGWELEPYSGKTSCKRCKSKTCPTGYSTSVTDFGTNGKSGDSTCYRICPTDYDYGKSVNTCGTTGSQGWGLETWASNYSCVKCKEKTCLTGYSTAATNFGTSSTYAGNSTCYRICPTDYDYDKSVSSCGNTGSSGWELDNWSSNSICKKCKAKTCPAGYSTAATNFGTSSTYAGNKTCYQICPTGYSNTITLSDCSSDTSGWELEPYSGKTSCKRCKSKTCPTGYSTSVTDFGTNGKSGDSTCYRICPTDYDYGKSVNTCGTTGSQGWGLETWASNYSCVKCKEKTCLTGYSTAVTSYGTSSTYAGNSTCYRICPTDYDYGKAISDCGSGNWELESWSSNSSCKKCTETSSSGGGSSSTTSCPVNRPIKYTNIPSSSSSNVCVDVCCGVHAPRPSSYSYLGDCSSIGTTYTCQ